MTLEEAVTTLQLPTLEAFIFDGDSVRGGFPCNGLLTSPYFYITPEAGAWLLSCDGEPYQPAQTLDEAVAIVKEFCVTTLAANSEA